MNRPDDDEPHDRIERKPAPCPSVLVLEGDVRAECELLSGHRGACQAHVRVAWVVPVEARR